MCVCTYLIKVLNAHFWIVVPITGDIENSPTTPDDNENDNDNEDDVDDDDDDDDDDQQSHMSRLKISKII